MLRVKYVSSCDIAPISCRIAAANVRLRHHHILHPPAVLGSLSGAAALAVSTRTVIGRRPRARAAWRCWRRAFPATSTRCGPSRQARAGSSPPHPPRVCPPLRDQRVSRPILRSLSDCRPAVAAPNAVDMCDVSLASKHHHQRHLYPTWLHMTATTRAAGVLCPARPRCRSRVRWVVRAIMPPDRPDRTPPRARRAGPHGRTRGEVEG